MSRVHTYTNSMPTQLYTRTVCQYTQLRLSTFKASHMAAGAKGRRGHKARTTLRARYLAMSPTEVSWSKILTSG